MSDIHGDYKAFQLMLEKVHFGDEDMLYILGDILDRGPNPIKINLDIMERPNVVVVAGNHCAMACECLSFLLREITDDSLEQINENVIGKLLSWQLNGSSTTLDEFHKCGNETKRKIIEYISDFELYEEIELNDKQFILVHAGLGNFEPNKELWEYELDELVWERQDYKKQYFEDKYVVTGHTPTMTIDENPRPGYIYKANNNIVIDCGCNFRGRKIRLFAVR